MNINCKAMEPITIGRLTFPIKIAPGNIKDEDKGNKKEKVIKPFSPAAINTIAAAKAIYTPIRIIKINSLRASFISSNLLTVAPTSPARVA